MKDHELPEHEICADKAEQNHDAQNTLTEIVEEQKRPQRRILRKTLGALFLFILA